MNACTVIAWNYLAHARVLADSFLQHHPSGRFSVLLLDDFRGEFSASGEEFHLVRPQDIMEAREFGRLSLMYDVTELATAVKPWLLRHLLGDGEPDVVFFDPDIQVFAPLDDIAELARRNSIVLTPHDIEPMPGDDLDPSELYVLRSGAYNLGFIALGRDATGFLDWWSARLRRYCLAATDEGLFLDQRWVDLVPGYFNHYILKDPGCNVAYWNLSNRKLVWDGEGYRVNDQPLRFFHFSGFTPDKPHLLSRHARPSPRILLSEHPDVRRICNGYAKRLLERGYQSSSARTYGLDTLDNGLRIDRRVRRLYRQAVVAFEQGKGTEPPDAHEDPDAFVDWLNQPVAGPPAAKVSRYLHRIHAERRDLQQAFPDLSSTDAALYLRWVKETGRKEEAIPGALLPEASATASSEGAGRYTRAGPLRPGINIVGYLRAELGVGEAARQLVKALEQSGTPLTTITVEETLSRQNHPFADRASETAYDINLICVNADMLAECVRGLGSAFFEGRHTIGLWHWEVSTFPEQWQPAFDNVDEVWVASEHTASCISPISPKPVRVVPLPVSAPAPLPGTSRAQLGLPDGFLFLFVYDFLSVFERKNPLALVEAFSRAFAPGEGPSLVLKSINGDKRIDALERLRLAAAEHPNVIVVDGYYSPEKVGALVALCDCYVSLHRAEGFGLTMAQAMAMGKPVIATGFSGNLTFMNEENAYLVRCRLEPVGEGCAPYPPKSKWAAPDLDHAAELMRRVYTHRREALERGRRGRDDILVRHSLRTCGEWIDRRLSEIRQIQLQTRKPADGPPPLARAQSRAAAFPGADWKIRSRYRPILPAIRSFLFRVLQPYTEQLRELHREGFRAIAELGRRVDAIELDRIPALRDELLEQHKRKPDSPTRLLERQRDMEAYLRQVVSDVTAFQDSARAHLAALTESVQTDQALLRGLTAKLNALPYTAESLRMRSDDGSGEEIIGYQSPATDSTSDVYVGFEDLFRGSRNLIRDRLAVYLEIVGNRRPLVDLGCGRGEFLDLLAATGMPGVGVDVNTGMVDLCRNNGHDVVLQDAIDFLDRQPDGSLGCIFSAQLIEHLPLHSLLTLFRLSRLKLAPGGLFVAETVNPHSVAAMKCFWADLSHQRPIFPEVAVALCRLHSFASARIFFPQGTGRLEEDLWDRGEFALVATPSAADQRNPHRENGSER